MPPALFQERRAPEARRVEARDPVPALALLLVRGPVQDLHPAQDLVQGRLVRELVPHLVRGPALAQDLVRPGPGPGPGPGAEGGADPGAPGTGGPLGRCRLGSGIGRAPNSIFSSGADL